jgi:hypothetical protein
VDRDFVSFSSRVIETRYWIQHSFVFYSLESFGTYPSLIVAFSKSFIGDQDTLLLLSMEGIFGGVLFCLLLPPHHIPGIEEESPSLS